LLREWPLSEGSLWWLNQVFNAKTWQDRQIDPFYEFRHDWEYVSFDDPDVETAFRAFYESVSALTTWTSRRGTLRPQLNPPGTPVEERTFSIGDGDDFPGGWKEYDRIRAEGGELAFAVFEARKDLERVGRSRRL